MAEIKWGDWIRVEDDVYLVAIIFWIDKHPIFSLVNINTGNRFSEPVWYKKIKVGDDFSDKPLPEDLIEQLVQTRPFEKVNKPTWLK